jgi:chromosome partitioning protein
MGIDKLAVDMSIQELLLGEARLQEVVLQSPTSAVDVIASNGEVVAAEVALMQLAQREFVLKNALLGHNYDWVIMDCPPSLNLLTLNALCAADGVLVPIQCEYYALEGLAGLLETIHSVQESVNPRLRITGLLRTMYDRRNKLANDVSNELLAHFGEQILTSIIPRNVRLAEAPSFGQSIFAFDPSSTGAVAYLALAQELLRRLRDQDRA